MLVRPRLLLSRVTAKQAVDIGEAGDAHQGRRPVGKVQPTTALAHLLGPFQEQGHCRAAAATDTAEVHLDRGRRGRSCEQPASPSQASDRGQVQIAAEVITPPCHRLQAGTAADARTRYQQRGRQDILGTIRRTIRSRSICLLARDQRRMRGDR